MIILPIQSKHFLKSINMSRWYIKCSNHSERKHHAVLIECWRLKLKNSIWPTLEERKWNETNGSLYLSVFECIQFLDVFTIRVKKNVFLLCLSDLDCLKYHTATWFFYISVYVNMTLISVIYLKTCTGHPDGIS